VFAEQAAIDQRRQISATRCRQFKTVLDQIGWHVRFVEHKSRRLVFFRILRNRASRKKSQKKKKEQGASPALKIVSTLFPRKIGFDLG
jgi:beta-lactamase class D